MRALTIILFILLLNLATATTLIENGSFETGDTTSWNVNDRGTCSGSVSVLEDTNATEGSYVLRYTENDLGSNICVSLSHPDTIPADANLSFDFYLNVTAGDDVDVLLFAVDENGIGSFQVVNVSGDGQFVDYSTEGAGTVWVQFPADTNSQLEDTDMNFFLRITTDAASHLYSIDLDNFRYNRPVYLINSLSYSENQGLNVDFNILNYLSDSEGGDVSNADCNADLSAWGGDVNANMPYDSINSRFYVQTKSYTQGDLNFTVNCDAVNKKPDSDTGSISFRADLSDTTNVLLITPIDNVTKEQFVDRVELTPQSELDYIEWKAESFYDLSLTVDYDIFNSKTDGRQYFIYTSSDGSDYAFNDTLTFGSSSSNPIQKIWDEDNEQYTYSFSDTMSANETKYYRLYYKYPYKHYFSIDDSSDWFNNLAPNVLDNNTFNVDEYSISQFANIRSILKEYVPDVMNDETNAFELQFTAWSDVNGTSILAGQTVNGVDSVSSVSLTSTPHTYSFTIDATDFDSQALILTTNGTSATVYITDYAIVARAFFTKRLELFKANGDSLNVFLLNGLSTRYLQEGRKFRIDTEAYDRQGNLDEFTADVYFDSVTANNKVKQTTIDMDNIPELVFSVFGFDLSVNFDDTEERIFNFSNLLMPSIIDLNGSAENPTPPRELIVQATIQDDNGTTVAIQSQTVKFIQYPYFPNDLALNFYPTEKRLGKHPSGILDVEISDPNVLEGFDIRIYSDANTVDSPNYRTKIYKDTDFSCLGGNCNLQLTVDDFIFEDVNLTTISIFSLLNTEYLDQDNNLTRVDRRIFVSPIEFDTAKVHQVVHRTDRTYSNTEEIPLVLVLRDSEATNLKGKIQPVLRLQNCDQASGGNCENQTLEYKPTGFVYDDKFNYNYYFFRHLYILDDGSLLPDGNFIGFRVTLTDQTGIRSEITPVLADKCQNNDINTDNFFPSVLGFLFNFGSELSAIVTGCNSAQFGIVSTTENTAQEVRIEIDISDSPSDPTQEGFFCLAPDTNNLIGKPLEQDFLCTVYYTVGEKPIDNFRFRITNKNSDLSVEGSTKQYKEYNIPYEIIAVSDVQLLKNELEVNQDTTINTLGDFFFETFNNLAVGFVNYTALESYTNFLTSKGIVSNLGADINLNKAFSPNNISGALFMRIKGIDVVNIQDYRNVPIVSENIDSIKDSRFLDFLATNNISVPETESDVTVVFNSLDEPVTISDDKGALVINESATTQAIDPSGLDNNAVAQKYDYIPKTLFFNLQSTMFFNNFSENTSLSIILRVVTNIKDTAYNATLDFLNNIGSDPVNVIIDYLYSFIVFIAILLGLLIVFATIYSRFKGRD